MKISVYVVDPDPAERRWIASALAPEVEDVLTFGSAEALLASVPLRVPALLIAAVALPGMDVSQLIRELRCADIDLPVIAIGADADVPAVVELMRAGAADFIAFPFTARKLRTAMRSLGDRVRAGSKRAKDEGLS